MLNPNPNRPTKKTIIKLKVKCNRKNAHAGREPWPFSSHESTLTGELSGQLLNRLQSACTNKPHPFVKNAYYIRRIAFRLNPFIQQASNCWDDRSWRSNSRIPPWEGFRFYGRVRTPPNIKWLSSAVILNPETNLTRSFMRLTTIFQRHTQTDRQTHNLYDRPNCDNGRLRLRERHYSATSSIPVKLQQPM